MLGRPIHAGATLLIAAALLAAGCARRTVARLPPPPGSALSGDAETGLASWYGAPYHGRPAASGEIYDMDELTAAHRTLPFGTRVEVTRLDNGKRVIVRITDRGPFVDGRIIDLSHAAAREIELVGPGTARVQLKVIETPERAGDPPPVEQFAVQAGAFSDRGRAESFRSTLSETFHDARVVSSANLWRVLVGRQLTLDQAYKLAAQIKDRMGAAVVVRDR